MPLPLEVIRPRDFVVPILDTFVLSNFLTFTTTRCFLHVVLVALIHGFSIVLDVSVMICLLMKTSAYHVLIHMPRIILIAV